MRNGQTPAAVFGTLVPQLTDLIVRHRPTAVVVEGDTVSAFAGALAASNAPAAAGARRSGLAFGIA
jgi:UDP-N-acetylglucosamine 2-epimerase